MNCHHIKFLRNLPLRNTIYFDDYFLDKSLKTQNPKNVLGYPLLLPCASPGITPLVMVLDLERFQIVVKNKVEKNKMYEIR